MFYVYVLRNESGRFYYGFTGDLRRRFEEHQSGESISTKGHRWHLVYYEAYAAKTDAVKRESNLKLRSNAFTQLRRRIPESMTLKFE